MNREELRNEIGHHRRASRITWYPSSVQPYSSLWITVQRFLMLNRPSEAAFISDFFVNSDRPAIPWISLNSNGTKSAEGPIRLARFARVLGETPGSFDRSMIGQFPRMAWPLFQRFRACKICFSEGFHSVLYSLVGLARCPVHDEELVSCNLCAHRLSLGLSSFEFENPGRCECGAFRISPRNARRPEPSAERDAALKQLADWIVAVGQRCWFDLEHQTVEQRRLSLFDKHLRCWQHRISLPPMPSSWALPEVSVRRDHVRQVVFGESFSTLPVTAVRIARVATDFPRFINDEKSTFKAVFRYLLRHKLRRCRRWLTRIALASDADCIVRHLAVGGDDARLAFALLIWWQSSVWSESLRDWFRKKRTYWTRPRSEAPRAEMPNEVALLQLENATRSKWVQTWVVAMELLHTWEQACSFAWKVSSAEDILWGRGVLDARKDPFWSAAVDDQGRLALLMDAPRSGCWLAEPSVGKAARIRAWSAMRAQRAVDIRALCSPNCIWYHARTCEWKAGSGPVPPEAFHCKRHRLVGVGERRLLFVVFSWADPDDPEVRFVARCLSLPVASTAVDVPGAIAGLKYAVKRYGTQRQQAY